jgi:hypothetical protein
LQATVALWHIVLTGFRQNIFARAQLALAAVVTALFRGDAAWAGLLIIDILVITGDTDLYAQGSVRRFESAAAKTVTSIGRTYGTKINAGFGDRAVCIVFRQSAGEAVGVVAAVIISSPGVAVKKAVLPLRVLVIARDPCREGPFIVVRDAGALLIEAVRLTVTVVVDAVCALTGAPTQLKGVEYGSIRTAAVYASGRVTATTSARRTIGARAIGARAIGARAIGARAIGARATGARAIGA